MFKLLALLFVQSILIFVINCELVTTQDGILNGTIIKTRKGETVYGFFKIPYAEPPVGNLRFQPPVKSTKWNGTLDATNYGYNCMQPYGDPRISEDCLYINIYTKEIKPSKLKPVIVFIHGGGLLFGGSTNGPIDYLMDRDIVYVSFNYRLGPFGFLALGTKDAYGNMGLKDQVLALKWIQKNIVHFGGNPFLVTLTGESAGGFSVSSHLVSPMSVGLFQRAIAMSGAITYQIPLGTSNVDKSEELAKQLNCSTHPLHMFSCLQQANALDIVRFSFSPYFSCLLLPWLPVVEPDLGQERFMVDEPNVLFRDGKFMKVPIITGMTADEFIHPVDELLSNPSSLTLLNQNFSEIASKCFYFRGNGNKSTEEIASILRHHYLPFETIDRRYFNAVAQLCGDGSIGYAVHKFAHYASVHTAVYYYKFTFIGRFSLLNFPHDKPYGVHHFDDMMYLLTHHNITEADPEYFMIERMTRIWEQFAKFGDPHNSTDPHLAGMHWPKLDLQYEYYMDIGKDMVEKEGLYLERYSIWDSL